MSTYVKLYPGQETPQYRSIPTGSFHAGAAETFLAGSMGKTPLFGLLNGQGNHIFQRRYLLDDNPAEFHRSVQCDNGDFILYGSRVSVPDASPSKLRNHHLLMRVKKNGGVIWAKTYFTDRTRLDVDFIKSVKDTYYFVALAVEGIELMKIGGDGKVLISVRIPVKDGDQVSGLIPFKDGCAIYGSANAGTNRDAFVAVFDATLTLQQARLIGDAGVQSAAGLLLLGDDRFVMTGEAEKSADSYVTQFQLGDTTVPALLFDFRKNSEAGHKLLRSGPGSSFYLVAEMPQRPRMSFVARFNSKFQIQWMRRFSIKGDHILFDLQHESQARADELAICGVSPAAGTGISGLAARTDADMNSCATLDLPVPRAQERKFMLSDWKINPERAEITEVKWKPKVINAPVDTRPVCEPSTPPDVKTNAKFQSPYIYLQTAGSSSADDSVSGFHLRWEFMRKLGEQHLPKGDLAAPGGPYPTNIAFNRADDYVRIYKNRFNREFGIRIDFTLPPTFVIETGPTRDWIYADLPSSAGLRTDVLLRFKSKVLYSLIRQTIDPMTQPQAFLQQYTEPLELHTSGKPFFYLDVDLKDTGAGGKMRLETISLPDPLDPSTRNISSRREIGPGAAHGLVGENWEYLRFDLAGVVPLQWYLIFYEDYIVGTEISTGWEFVDRYSLDDGKSDGNAAVFRRLEDPARFTVDKKWRKFNEPTADEFRLNVKNYRKRWTLPDDGLKAAVETYLDVSRVDPLANVTLPNQDDQPNDASTEVSYLTMLQFTGLDFHVARMLGLGTIDPMDNLPSQFGYVYMMQYYTQGQLENEPPKLVSHVYMAPPVTLGDHRLPPSPDLLPVVYGLAADQCGGTTPLTDADGYVPFADVRYINLHRGRFQYELPFEPFFAHSVPYDLFKTTQPMLFGVEYARGPVGAGAFVRPEISNDPEWLDPAGLPEVRPIPDTGENPVYTHAETDTGVHHYAMYSINWFSRVSPPGNQVQTDATVFDPRNTMAPPANFKVYLVQHEPALILSTQAEQDMLEALTSQDKTLVRVMFDWNQVQNTAYQFADKAQLFFRVAAPRTVKGKIVSVTEDTFTHTATLFTGPYTQASQPNTVQPFVAAGDMARFVGAALVAGGQTFLVDAVITSGDNPRIRVKSIRQTSSADSLNENFFCTLENFLSPESDVQFLMVESLDSPAAWDTQLSKEIAITQFTPTYTEEEIFTDGTSVTRFIGGLTDAAEIADIFDPDPGLGAFIPVGGPPADQVPTGIYTVTFDNENLAPHPDPDVSYYQGTIRLGTVSGGIRELIVWSIETTGATLRLVVFDPTFSLKRDSNGTFILTGFEFTPQDGVDPIVTGPVPLVNFHPGYRAYLQADPAGGHNFGEAAILPGLDEGTKQTFMTIRSVDSSVPNMESYMAVPVVLLAMEIRDPVPPGVPLGPLYATRPNFYGKATYTFDCQVNQPFSLIFYRANERKILDQLYDPDKVREIYAQLDALTEEDLAFDTNRWNDLVSMVTDAGGEFMQYVLDGFRFPPPTNPKYTVPDPLLPVRIHPFSIGNTIPPGSSVIALGTGRSWAAIVREAIEGAFLPLTETPPVYSQIRNTSIETSGRPPKVRDSNGNRIPPTDPRYDPWPMVVRHERNAADQVLIQGMAGYGNPANRRFVRFTDYTLDGAARNKYFYFSKELSNTLLMSDKSSVVGPVKLVNAAPAEAPGIGRVLVSIANSVLGTKDGIVFELNGYLPSEGIRQIQLYRATNPDDALSIRTMILVKTVDADAELIDTFDDVPFLPYGEPIFYRIVALREIRNERSQLETIPSKQSNVVIASLIDNSNPRAPRLSYSSDTPIGSPVLLHNVILKWEPTCYGGTYYVYKRTSGDQWKKIAVQQGNAPLFYQELLTSELLSDSLAKEDEDGNRIYHQFRVVAMNSSGLLSTEEAVLSI